MTRLQLWREAALCIIHPFVYFGLAAAITACVLVFIAWLQWAAWVAR